MLRISLLPTDHIRILSDLIRMPFLARDESRRSGVRQGRTLIARSRHTPHQGEREIARRKRQIEMGRLQVTG